MIPDRADDVDQAPRLGDLRTSLGFLLRVAQARSFERFHEAFGRQDLRPGEFALMSVIRLNPGIRQGIVAETLSIKAAHMTKMVRRLEDLGRVRRAIPDSDRRSVQLFITDTGVAFLDSLQNAFSGEDDYQKHGLSEVETRQLARLLRRYVGLEGGEG